MVNQGEINRKVTEEINQMWIEKDIKECEFKLDKCIGTRMGLHNCHRHKRNDYKVWGLSEKQSIFLLSHFNQVMRGCLVCDSQTEYDRKLIEEKFIRNRGRDILEYLINHIEELCDY